ncbi:MAG: tetratricopeptide repeat protein [Myxococcota bacterium]|nr:tetratricopeptide repeat protein [Myxococcota bacterium]
MRTTISVLLSIFTFSTIGCGPKETVPKPTDGPNPRYEFVMGVKTLQKPDRKTGEYDYETAYNHFLTATQLDQEFVEAYYNAAWTAEKMDNIEDAINYYQQAYEKSGSKSLLWSVTDILRENKRSADASKLLQAYHDKNPKDSEVLYSLVESYTESELYDEANKAIEKILLYNPKDVKAYRLLSRNYHAQQDYAMSLLCAEKANEIAEGDPGISNNMGVTYLEMKKEPQAIQKFKDALQKDNAHLEANLNMGFVSLASGNYGLAQQRFDAALTKHPEHVLLKVGHAIALRGNGETKAAEKIYKELLKKKPSEQIVYFNAATFYAKYKKNYKEAEKILQDYKSRFPEELAVEERIDRVLKLQAEEEARKEAERKKKEEERKRKERQKKQFEKLKAEFQTADTDYKGLTSTCGCSFLPPPTPAEGEEPPPPPRYKEIDSCANGGDNLMMAKEYLDQVADLIAMEDHEIAADALPFVKEAQAGLEEVKAMCVGAPAPVDGEEGTENTEAGTEGAENTETGTEGTEEGSEGKEAGDTEESPEAPAPE